MKAFLNRFLLYSIYLAMLVIFSACGKSPLPMKAVIFSAQHTETPQATPTLMAEQDFGLVQPTETLEIIPSSTVEQVFSQSTATPVRVPCLTDAQDSGFIQSTGTPYIPMDAEKDLGYRCAIVEMTKMPVQDQVLSLTYQPENNPQEEIAVTVRKLVEDKEQPILALLGATTNENTMRLASLSNFFNVPMVIPSSAGDNLLPSNNLWGFRLSLSGAAHAQYFFGSVLNHSMVQSFSDKSELAVSAAPPFKVAILYEQNTFGESAAVAAATIAMKQEMEIGFYGSFDSLNPDTTRLKSQADEIRKQGVHLIYLVSNQPGAALIVINTIRAAIPNDEMPVMLGQSSAFSSREFLDNPASQGIFVLRQKIFMDHCPKEIEFLTDAQSYAAVQLLRSAIKQAKEQAGNTYAAQTLAQKREAVRDVLKATNNKNLDCLGQVSFDNIGQNKNMNFEILQITSNGFITIDEQVFGAMLKPIYDRSPFGSGK